MNLATPETAGFSRANNEPRRQRPRDASPEDLSRFFELAASLGASIVAVGGTMALARRLAPIADQRGMLFRTGLI
jgi:hypothetical protein